MAGNTTSIAIVGMGGIFPGARDFEEFWANIANARDAAKDVDPKRWVLPVDEAYRETIAEEDHV